MTRKVVTVTEMSYTVKVFKEGSQWVAECETAQLAAQGPTIYEALESLGVLFAAKGLGTDLSLTVH